MRRLVFLLVLLVLAAGLPVAGASALTYPVTSLADGGPGSLRASVEAANARPGEDTIPIAVTGTIVLEEALPAVADDVAIGGRGADMLTIERGAATEFRIFDFADDVSGSLSGLTVSGGADPQGGGIRNGSGSLALTFVVVADNKAKAEDGADVEVEGGGVFSSGPLVVRQSVIRDNVVTALAATTLSSGRGGGIAAQGPLLVDRSTVSGNSVVAGNSLTNEARGGGLQGVELTLTSSTVTGNSLFSTGAATGANIEFSGTTLIRDTIVAHAVGDDKSCSTPEGSGGFNLDEDGSCGFDQGSDLLGVAAGLDPVLRDNGGPTPTHALLPGSIAIDRGNSFGSGGIDQRGLPRPSDFGAISNTEGGDGSDIGAFELQVPLPPAASGGPVLVSAQPADRQPPNTRIVKGPARSGYETKAKFRFASSEAQSSFQCKLDGKRWRGCRNPYKRTVNPGKHLFRVRAVDRFGNVDSTPARFGWRVKPLGG